MDDLHKLPPQSIETEESVLAYCLLHDPADAIESLLPDHFYKTANKTIFEAMSELYSQNEPIDIALLVNHLRGKGDLEQIGGATYLSKLMDTVPASSNIFYHIKIIRDKAIKRRLIETVNQISNQCFEDHESVETILDRSQRDILAIDYKQDRDAKPVCEILDDVISRIEERSTGGPTGIKSGISRIDLLLGGFQPGDSIILAGRPSMGKTSLALNFINYASVDCNIPSAIFSLEMAKGPLVQRLLSMDGRVDGGKFLNNMFVSDDWDRITDAAGRIAEAPIYIDDRSGLSYMEVSRSLRKLVKKHGVEIAVIDYLQLMTGDRKEGRTREIGSISRAIKGMAKENGIPIIAICQLSRGCEQRADKRPMLSDLRDSGEIEQDADVVMFIYRDEVYYPQSDKKGTAEILIRKHRNGAIGQVTMSFLKSYQRFEQLEERYGDYS